jgi:hypothetical protein
VHQAVLAFLADNRRWGWRMHLDIRHYFPSVSHQRLEALLFPQIRDRRVRWLIRRVLESGERVYRSALARKTLAPSLLPRPPRTGLPLGSWFSQWAGAYYLDGLDHYVTRQLKPAAICAIWTILCCSPSRPRCWKTLAVRFGSGSPSTAV